MFLLALYKAQEEDRMKQISLIILLFFTFFNILFSNNIVPNDEFWEHEGMWGFKEGAGINVPEAWTYTTGSKTIRVGIIDNGVSNHPDLDDNLVTGRYFRIPDGTYSTGIEDSSGDSHGTKIAGIIAATGNNGIGIAGINWNVSIVPLKAENLSTNAIVRAIRWAGTNNIDILNISLGGFGTNTDYATEISKYPHMLVVMSAGNNGIDVDNMSAIICI